MELIDLCSVSDLCCRLELLLLLWLQCSLCRLLMLKQARPQSFLDTSPKVWVLLKKLEYGVIVILNLAVSIVIHGLLFAQLLCWIDRTQFLRTSIMVASIKDLRLSLFFSISLKTKLLFNFSSQNTLFFDSQIKKVFVLCLSDLRLILTHLLFFKYFYSTSLILIGLFPLWLDLLLHLLVF